jgi:hypothetical protein
MNVGSPRLQASAGQHGRSSRTSPAADASGQAMKLLMLLRAIDKLRANRACIVTMTRASVRLCLPGTRSTIVDISIFITMMYVIVQHKI